MKRMKPETSPAQTFAEAGESRTENGLATKHDSQRQDLFARMGAEIRTIWEISSHGHAHGAEPGQHTH